MKRPSDGGASTATRDFRAAGDGRYVLSLLEVGIQFDLDRVRRDHHELVGELSVRCDLAGARTFEGTLSIADFNLSSARARKERGTLLAERSKAPELDWLGLLEEFVQRVLAAERTGQPAVLLRDLEKPTVDEDIEVEGFRLLRRHPMIVFGDGGAAKSLLGLYLAGQLERRGARTLFVDWEFAGEDHRDRLERLFGAEMPAVRYVRCDRPMVAEADRLRRIVRDEKIDYCVYDSIAFACDGPPESAEVAAAYYRAVRQIGVGSLHIAHITKSEGGDQKPFGSAFWHNGARATWFAQRASGSLDGRDLNVGLFNRKSNVGPLRPALGFQFTFDAERTIVTRTNVADVADLAGQLPLWQRIAHLVRTGPKTIAELAAELDAKADTVTKAVTRGKSFVRVLGADGIHRFGLAERRTA